MVRAELPHRHLIAAAILSIILGLAACSSGSPEVSVMPSRSATASTSPTAIATPPPSTPPSTEPSPQPTDSGEYACGVPFTGVGSTARAQITDVRVGTHDGYDRVVFAFDTGIPAYSVEIVTPPFTADPSGLPLAVEGNAFLRITLTGGTKVTPGGALSYAGPSGFRPGFDELVQLVEGGDFEAVSTWYVGLASDPCLNVFALTDTPRLVIDIRH